MCLYLTPKSEIQTATRDIEVWKIISRNDKSIVMGFKYFPNTLYRLRKKLRVEEAAGQKIIRCGFHSYASFRKVTYEMSYHDLEYKKVVRFIIPKGAKYIKGKSGEIVSTSLRSDNLVNAYNIITL